MINYWPKQLNPSDFSPQQRSSIKLGERLRQLEAEVKKLEESKK